MTALTTLVESPARRLTGRISPWGLELGEGHFVLSRLGGTPHRPLLRHGRQTSMESAPPYGDPAGLAAWTGALRAARGPRAWSANGVVVSLPGSQVDTFPLRVEA